MLAKTLRGLYIVNDFYLLRAGDVALYTKLIECCQIIDQEMRIGARIVLRPG